MQRAIYLIILLMLSGCTQDDSRNSAVERQLESDWIITLDPSDRAQEIEGFGASDAWIIDPMVREWTRSGHIDKVEELADMLFSVESGIGLSMWRFNIGAGSAEQGNASRIPDPFRRAELFMDRPFGNIDDSKQAGQVLFAQAAAARGVEEMIAFINSPPVWATKNRIAHPGSRGEFDAIGSTNLKADMLEPFADFQAKTVAFLRAEKGLPITYLSPINEPTWHWTDQTQEGNRYNNQQVRDLYLAAYAALETNNLIGKVKIDAGETVEYRAALSDKTTVAGEGKPYNGGMNAENHGLYRDYIGLLLGDPLMQQVTSNKISLHGYFSDALPERIVDLRQAVRAEVKAVSPNATIWMSEFCILGQAEGIRPFDGHGFDVNDMDYALHVARIIHHDLVDMDASAWMWWLAVTAYDYKDGLLKIDRSLQPDSLQASKLMWALGNFSRFVRPGFSRVNITASKDSDLLISAYLSQSGKDWVLVAVNLKKEAQSLAWQSTDSNGQMTVTNIPAEWQMYVTNEQYDLSKTESTIHNRVVLPPRSVITLTGRSEN